MKDHLHYCPDCEKWHDGPCYEEEWGGGREESLFLVIAGVIVGGAIWLLIWVLS